MKHYLLILTSLTLAAAAFAQTSARKSAANIWQDVDERPLLKNARLKGNVDARRNITPQAYRTLELGRALLQNVLASAPPESAGPIGVMSVELSVPMPDGSFARFNIQESPVMDEALARKYPEIKTYVGQGVDDPAAVMRMDLTPQGFHAQILSPNGQVQIDPYWRDSDTTYLSYRKQDYLSDKPFSCLTKADEQKLQTEAQEPSPNAPPSGATLKKYRLALACTGEYATAVCAPDAPTLTKTLAAMVTSVNRVSGVYERDLAIRLVLVPNTDSLIYLNGGNDPYTNDDGETMLDENQSNIDRLIGSANYDIGHVFSTGGGGIASTNSVCNALYKAMGVTGRGNPTGDPFDIDYVAHEMGHQFNAPHTFNSTAGSCAGNRTGSAAYEVGSGITIMAYAGICGTANLAPNSDDYFHTGSFTTIDNYTTTGTGSSCPLTSATGNTPPTINALSAYSIPANTPFALTGSASDPDGDTLSYCWEEFDAGTSQGTAQNPSATATTAAIFRPFAPTLSPTRYFPSLTYILNNGNIPPSTNPAGYATGEVLPTVARALKFRLTVRDNRAGGGGSTLAQTTVTTFATGASFAVTSPNTATTLAGGSLQTVTWNVAGTTAAPINCANVNLLLSTDGGYTFPTVLAAGVPNNGSSSVTIPQIATTQGRIKVEGAGNIFFDISNADFTITSTNTAPTINIANSITVARGTPTPVIATIGSVGDAENDTLSVSVSDLPYRATVVPTLIGNSISLSAQVECSLTTTLTTRTYPFTITVTDSQGARTSTTANLIVTPNLTPAAGAYPSISLPQFGQATSNPSPVATDANGNLGAAPYSIAPTTLPGGGTIAINQATGAITAATTAASTVGTTNVRVTVTDTCGAASITTMAINVFASNPAASYFAGYGLTGGNAAFAFDYDFDGIENLLEYALHLNPTVASQAGLPVVTAKDYSGTQYLSMTFTRFAPATDVTYIVEGSSDLTNWSTLASSAGGAITSGPGFVSESGNAPALTVEVRDTTPITSATSPRFLRLRVTSP